MKSIVIKNGTLVTAEKTFSADIKVMGKEIVQISNSIKTNIDDEIVNAKGLFLLPGAIDAHTHLNLTVGENQVSDGWEHGSKAAVLGGTTTIIEHLAFGPDNCSLLYQIDNYLATAEGNSVVDYALHGVFQHFNENTSSQLAEAVKMGVSSFKAYMTYSKMLSEEDLLLAMLACQEKEALLTVHAENNTVCSYLTKYYKNSNKATNYALTKPDYAESLAVETLLSLAKATGNVPIYIVHLSSEKALAKIIERQKEGQNIIVETCPQYLLLSDKCYETNVTEALKYVMAPVLRKEEDKKALWKSLNTGNISVVATDHCYFSWADKKNKSEGNIFNSPGGIPGVECRNSLLFSEGVLKKKITENKWVELTATNPAKIFGLKNKGQLKEGYDADIVLFNPNKEKTLNVNTLYGLDYTPFENFKVKGWAETVFLRGKKVVENYQLKASKGYGRFVKREPFNMEFFK